MRGSWDAGPDPLDALRSGNPGPFEAFVRGGTRRLLAFFLHRGAEPSEAEDLVQEVLLKLHGAASGYERRERFGAFVMRVARNAWIDHTRRRAARPADRTAGEPHDGRGAAADLESREPTPGAGLEVREEAARLLAALRDLPEGQRAAFELGVLEGRPYEEVARALDVPVGTVKSRVFAAVRRLRAAVEPPEPAAPAGSDDSRRAAP